MAGILVGTAVAVVGLIALTGVGVHRSSHHTPQAPATAIGNGLLTAADLGRGWNAYSDQAAPATTATTSLPDGTEQALSASIDSCLHGSGFPSGSASSAAGRFVHPSDPRSDLFVSVEQWASPQQAAEAFAAFNVGQLTSCTASLGEKTANEHMKALGLPSLRPGQTIIETLPKPQLAASAAAAGRSIVTMQFLVQTTAEIYTDIVGIQEGRYTASVVVVSSFAPLSEDAEFAIEQAADNHLLNLG